MVLRVLAVLEVEQVELEVLHELVVVLHVVELEVVELVVVCPMSSYICSMVQRLVTPP